MVEENHFDDSHVFEAKSGLNIAVGLFHPWQEYTLTPIDPSYGSLRFTKFSWGIDEAGESIGEAKVLIPHECTPEELGITGQKHEFWPIEKSQASMLEKGKNLFLCVDKNELAV